jgi:hypothetical protein
MTCDDCDIIIDSDLDFKEYKENYGKSGPKKDYCWKCRESIKRRKRHEKVPICTVGPDYGWFSVCREGRLRLLWRDYKLTR